MVASVRPSSSRCSGPMMLCLSMFGRGSVHITRRQTKNQQRFQRDRDFAPFFWFLDG